MSKISELSDGGVIQGGDTLIAVRSGGNVKVTYGGSTTANIDGGTIDGTVIGGTTPAAGSFTTGSFTGDVSFADNAKAIFGASNDLEIFHTGTYSNIRDAGTGALYIGGDAEVSILNASLTEYKIKAETNGAVTLYYDNASKLATTASGVDVTGTVTADGLTVDGNAVIDGGATDNTVLTLDSGTANTYLKITDSNSTNGAFIGATTNDLNFYPNNSLAVTMTAAGNLLVGTSSAIGGAGGTGAQLFLKQSSNSNGICSVANSNDNFVRILHTGTIGKVETTYGTGSYTPLTFFTGGSERLRITSSGACEWRPDGTTQAMTLDASGNLLVGRTSTSGLGKLNVEGGADFTGGNVYLCRDSGNVLVGTTTGSFGAKITAENTTSYNFESRRTGTGSEGHVVFGNANGAVGSIFTSGTATSYNTSSDYRLKENITDANDAGDKIDAIKVRQYNWKVDGSHQDYGMVAQELMTVAPEAVHQPEDPDQMMGVDYSKLVPMLIKEVQSLRARVAQLEGAN